MKELGLRPLEYIRREKLNYAPFIFRNSEETISEVAAMLAFPSASAFTKQFETQFVMLLFTAHSKAGTIRHF